MRRVYSAPSPARGGPGRGPHAALDPEALDPHPTPPCRGRRRLAPTLLPLLQGEESRRRYPARACVRSAIRSSGFSMPIDSRIVESLTPSASRLSLRHARVGRARGMRGERFSVPPRLTASLKILQPVQHLEGGPLAALHIKGEGRARPRRLRLVHARRSRAGGQRREVMHLLHRGMGAEVGGDLDRILPPPAPCAATGSSTSARASSQECGSSLRADGGAQRLIGRITGEAPSAAPAIRSEWPPT